MIQEQPLNRLLPTQTTGISPTQNRPRRSLRRRSPLILILLIVLWSIVLGVILRAGLAQATPTPAFGTVDPVPERFQLGKELYLEHCGTCHVAVPPETMPTETWRRLLQDPQHYGVQLQPLVDPPRLLVWNYLRNFSRPLREGETVPYRMEDSRYFQALHPRVELPRRVRLDSCRTCHINVDQYDYRSLAPEWQDAP